MKKYYTNREYAEFVIEQYKKSNFNQYQIAEKLGKKQSAINRVLNIKKYFPGRGNKLRAQVLSLLEFEAAVVFSVKKIAKK